MEYEKKYNDLIARINEAKEKPSLCMKDKHHYNGYVETGIRDALDYIINPENEDEKIRTRLIALVEAFGQGKYKDEMLAYLEKQKEQKPAEWSEEDEKIKNNLLSELFNLYVGAQIKESTYFKYKEFIKNSIPKIKQLTIEQKSAISRAIFIAKSMGEESLARVLNTIYNETNVVQPHWKPSEGQMDHLAYAYTQLKLQKCYAPHVYESLGSLYDDLKKLI